MSAPLDQILNPRKVVALLGQQWRLWAPAIVLCTLGGLAYALVKPDRWTAQQALVVRDEAGGTEGRQGEFRNPDAMKTALETVLEIARSRTVVSAALAQAGPPPQRRARDAWPNDHEIEALQQEIGVSAPQGAEFGATEVIYLGVTGPTRARAMALNTAVCDALQARLQDLRNARALGLMGELEKTLSLAQGDLDVSTLELEQMEREVGSDLGELRTLNELGAGDSNLRNSSTQIKNELRQARTLQETSRQQLELLRAVQEDPAGLVATPNKLLESQPALRRLKEGLIDAQLRTAEILSKMSQVHPTAQAAVAAEEEVRQDLRAELDLAILGLRADLQVSDAQVTALDTQLVDVNRRLDRLAGMRARYNNLVAEVTQRTAIAEKARGDLADARASQVAARTGSLIIRLDGPETGSRPVGPGRSTIVLAGLAGGLAVGLGLMFLSATGGGRSLSRRCSDYLRRGRRASDALAPAGTPAAGAGGQAAGSGRRLSDLPPAPAVPAPGPSAADRRTEDRRAGRS